MLVVLGKTVDWRRPGGIGKYPSSSRFDEVGRLYGELRVDSALGYDTSRFHALQRELERLNAAALRTGLITARDVSARASPSSNQGESAEIGSPDNTEQPASGDSPQPMPSGSADKGKASAKQLLTMLGRIEGDNSPSISGTSFTESGVVRLLTHLRRPRIQRNQFFRQLYRFLIRPVPMGVHTSAGVSVGRLQLVSHQLLEIEAHGWLQFQSIRALRRGARGLPSRSNAASRSEATSQTAVRLATDPSQPKAP